MPSKIALFYNHSSRYLGVDVTLSVMPMQDWDTESMGISAENLGRHLVLPHPEWDRAAGGKSWLGWHARKGKLAPQAMLAAKQASAAFGSPFLGRWGTNSHMSSQIYAPWSNSPEALESGRANTKEKYPTQNDFFPRGKTKQKQLFLIAAKRAYELPCRIFLHTILQMQSGCHYQKRFLWTDNQHSTVWYITI